MEFNKQKRKFDKPLFVYRINTPDITKIMIEMAKHLIEKKYVEYIFLERQLSSLYFAASTIAINNNL